MRKVCVITGTRAEYGLLYWTLKALQKDPSIELQLCVTGMHLSPEFGLTYKQIEEDGFIINSKVETLLSSDSSQGISKSIGLGIIGFSDAFEQLQPDIILVLGDRFEIFAAVSAAMCFRIPVAHCHGGEATEGVIDESIRHSITKMSHIHFTSTKEYKNRVIQLGESPKNVFNTGALGIENINLLKLFSKTEFEKSIGRKLAKKNVLITFHPVTLEKETSEEQFSNLIETLNEFEDLFLIFTYPNADNEGRIIIKMIDEYTKNNPNKSVSFISMGQLRYLSALQYVDFVIGNSSSGIIEVPSFKIPTINIGDRQKGRVMSASIINCLPTKKAIANAIKKAIAPLFKSEIKNISNPYDNGNSSATIVKKLKEIEINKLLKKEFFNIRIK